MSTPPTSAKAIFLQALELITVTEREAYLETQCGSDAGLRREVEELLRHQGEVGSFLESPPTAVAESAEQLHTIAPQQPSLGFLSPSPRADSLGRLGHYEILEIVGSGGMGVVLKAIDEQLQRVVAIKAMAQSLAASATARQRFVREAQAAAAVNHDNVVDIYAVEEAGPVPYLAMEYVAGVSLEDKLQQRGPLELKEILRIGLQTADGLAAAHRQGLVHRDVKPANILLENGVGRVKITDFGLARAVDDVLVTQTGVIAGTPAYMSPEQARGDAVDHRSDLFSLGSVLYALCTGQAPFRSGTSLGVLKRICEESPPSLRELNPDIPDWLCLVIEKLHAKLPAERFQSAAELAETLGRYLAHVQQPSLPLPTAIVRAPAQHKPQSSKTAHAPRHNRRRWAVAAVAALVVLGATLSLTEAGGVTHVAATVIRIFTPEGTLVVEVDDPAVKVTIEGDGGLIIRGAGAQEVHVKPGSYKVRATKDGKPVPVDQELVTITRGGKQVVKVSREEAPASKPLSQEQKLEQARQQLEEADRLYKLGEPLRGSDPWQAELHFRKAVAIYEKLGQDFPESPASKQKLAACRWSLASALNLQVHHLVYKGTELTAEEAARAIAAGKEVMELAPADSGYWTNLGMAHYRAKDWNAALAALEKGPATQDYNSSCARFGLALVHWQLGHRDQARQFYDQAAQWMDQNKPNDPLLRRDRAEAAKLIEIEIPKNPGAADQPSANPSGETPPVGKLLSQEQKLEQARQQLEEADRLYKLGEPLRGSDPWQAELHFRKAVAIYEKLGQDFPESPASKQKLAACRWSLASALNMQVATIVLKSPPATLEESQRAVALSKEAVGLGPTHKGFWIGLGWAQGRAGDWKAAREALEKAEQLPTSSAPVFHEVRTQFLLAITFWQLGDQVKARERYQQAAEIMEKHRWTDFELRTLQAEAAKLLGIEIQATNPGAPDQKRTNPAGDAPPVDAKLLAELAGYDATLTENPNDLATVLKRGDVLRRLKRYDDAVAALSRVISNASDTSQRVAALQTRALTHAERGHLQGTIEDYEECLRYRSEEVWIYGRVAMCYSFGPSELRNPERALKYAEAAIQVPGGAHAGYHTLHGVCLYRVGRHREALEVLERAYEDKAKNKDGQTALNRFFAAMAYQQLHEPAKAQACFALALKLPQPTGDPAKGMNLNSGEELRAEATKLLGPAPNAAPAAK